MIRRPADPPVLRWVWRTFALNLGDIRARLPGLAQAATERSREMHIVSALVPHDARIRLERLDVDRLMEVSASGVELWDPVLHSPFPISAADVARLFAIWRVPRPRLEREHYSLTLFLEDIVSRSPDLHVADVETAGSRFVHDECAAEFALVTVGGVPFEMLSLEHEREAPVRAALAELGLTGARNVSYAQAIKEVLGLTALPSAV